MKQSTESSAVMDFLLSGNRRIDSTQNTLYEVMASDLLDNISIDAVCQPTPFFYDRSIHGK